MNNQEYYDSLASSYSQISKRRKSYLDAVDNFIIEKKYPNKIENYLDIGAGDGRRTVKIMSALNIKKGWALDDSIQMLKDLNAAEIKKINMPLKDFKTDQTFDLITCLWNVLGHVVSREERNNFLSKVSTLLSPGGYFVFDVNNRYNIKQYGYNNVMENLKNDHRQSKTKGVFKLSDSKVSTQVYIHSPFDIEEYVSHNFKLDGNYYIDYDTGQEVESFFEGQLLYFLTK